ncbi:type I restriction endonuclease subunit R [Flavobacterium nackdongense]|uniref:Type I restriction enzyme endonuclease subunit n=1 Tax=Flavobacterium nackdongense TaxID=2547394 RepID=A0A4P6YHE4_9FLAO|nr:type I restriction endonuclease subunit R [Flavobacterium nackdongense]QBN20267.1 type I restriction endonuclease subunit R [Flavobacterium nackdongense]
MSKVGQIERATQNRIVKWFQDTLKYDYLGNWEEREGNSNIEEDELRKYLQGTKKYSEELINKAIFALKKEATINSNDDLFTANKEVYSLLRYGTSKKVEAIKRPEHVDFIDWENPLNNNFAIAEEVTIRGAKERRPDIVIYINGIALGVLELKKASVSASEGIRQNLSNQLHLFNKSFFTTIQFVLAGNDSNGLYYGTTKTEEKYFLKWKEDNDVYDPNVILLDKHIEQFCNRERLLEIVHDFVIFDHGTKKLCRPNQYFGIKEAQKYIARKEGGIIWHTQGSGKSLTMVWLAKWILENNPKARLLIVTDRTDLDEQIEGVFLGVGETITRTKSGADLISRLNNTSPRLLCSLVHKFGGKEDNAANEFIEELKISKDFQPKGDFIVFIDECHRTQSGELHSAMKTILPDNSIFIGFTGTPLLKKDKKKSLEIFGRYIHSYKFDEAVRDGVVLDLLYEARDVDQHVFDQKGIDEWFAIVTHGMNDIPKAELKQKWGTMQKVLSTKTRLEKIVFDIKKDFITKPRLKDGRGNAILVARSIYEACRYYEIFQSFGIKKCGIITSFEPNENSIKIEETGAGETEKKEQFEIYQKMLKDYDFKDAESFEKFAKKKFKEEPANMQLLIVVDKLLTGFDAIHCTYLYIDKQMQDHGLFQAICRTNRLGKEEENDPYYKEFGYIVDYKNLLENLNKSISDYTSDAFDEYDIDDVKGLLTDRLEKAKERLEDAIEALHQLCLDIPAPKQLEQYYHYFCGDPTNKDDLKDNEQKRLTLYKLVVALIRAYNNIASEIIEAGYTQVEADKIKDKVNYYAELRNSIKHYSSDYIDLKKYEPDMRQMLDMYLTADPSRVLSNLGEATLLQLIVDNGIEEATDKLPSSIKGNRGAMSETIENNMRKTIIQEMPINPAYYEKMSVLLVELIRLRKEGAISYEELLKEYEELARSIQPNTKKTYPATIDTKPKQALYDNLDKNEELANELDQQIRDTKDDDWRSTHIKRRKVEIAIRQVLESNGINDELMLSKVFDIVSNQREY